MLQTNIRNGAAGDVSLRESTIVQQRNFLQLWPMGG